MNLNKAKNIFIVGIKGVAMTNLAVILKKMGKSISGSDIQEEFITDEILKEKQIEVFSGFSKELIPAHCDLVIYGAAHNGASNAQVTEAQKRKIPVVSQAEFLGNLLDLFETRIAVCGSHGKTTTSSLLAHSLLKLGAKPSYLVGSSSFGKYLGGDLGDRKYFIVEADEYGVEPPVNKQPKFSYLDPQHILCTNIDFDHPDVYANLDEVKQAFASFFQKRKKLFLCADDFATMSITATFPTSSYFTFGYDRSADIKARNYQSKGEETEFEIEYQGKRESLKIRLFGKKNVSNACGVIAVLLNLGFAMTDIKAAIRDFSGAKRRFELRAYQNEIYLFDDYAHHPAEIKATIRAARERFRDHRILVIFQPHTFSRTKALLHEFGESLTEADRAFLAPIFPSAREKPANFPITSDDIVRVSGNTRSNIQAFSKTEDLVGAFSKIVKRKDVVFTMGAGDIYKLDNDIIELIKRID